VSDNLEVPLPGYGKEISESLRKAREACGLDIEWTLALRKLDLIQNKNGVIPLDNDDFLEQAANTRKIRFQGATMDFGVTGNANVGEYEERTNVAIIQDFDRTAQAYKDMQFAEGDDLTRVARNETEKGVILEAAKLLGYQVVEHGTYGNGEVKRGFYPQEKFRVGGNLEKILSTRIEVGIKNLLLDYEAEARSVTDVNRSVVRTIVSMVDAEAKVFRSPARNIGPGYNVKE
jgi:hypothetical protein